MLISSNSYILGYYVKIANRAFSFWWLGPALGHRSPRIAPPNSSAAPGYHEDNNDHCRVRFLLMYCLKCRGFRVGRNSPSFAKVQYWYILFESTPKTNTINLNVWFFFQYSYGSHKTNRSSRTDGSFTLAWCARHRGLHSLVFEIDFLSVTFQINSVCLRGF